jgi:lipoprotein
MNMKLKKLLALLLAMMMAFALVACGDTADTGDDAADDQQVQDDAAADDTQTSPEGQSLLTILADQFIPAPEVAGTYWTFIGGYVDGVQMTADQTQEVMSQLHDVYQFIFVDESKVVLAEDEEQTEGTYSLSEDGGTMKIEVGGVTYAGTFIDKDGHTVMVAMLDGTGMNALYFQEIIEG